MVEVDAVDLAVAALHALALRESDQISDEAVTSGEGGEHARFDLLVSPERLEATLDAVGALGRVTSRRVTTSDAWRADDDAGIELENLKTTLSRYEALLEKARDVKDMLAIEAEMTRVRGEIARIEGMRRLTEAHVAHARLHVDLSARGAAENAASTHPGLRLASFTSFGHLAESRLGGGVSLLLGGRFSFDIDVFRARHSTEPSGPDLVAVSAGGEFYSRALGGGRRRFLNPYFGLRAGYVRMDPGNAAIVGVTAGVELVRLRAVLLDAQIMGGGLLGAPGGSTLVVEPALTLRAAF